MHKILLVEDDQVIRQQLGKLLSEWGFQVVLVEDFMDSSVKITFFHFCLFLMVTTGARRFARFPKCRLCFCLRETRRWILSWRSIWERTTL